MWFGESKVQCEEQDQNDDHREGDERERQGQSFIVMCFFLEVLWLMGQLIVKDGKSRSGKIPVVFDVAFDKVLATLSV